MSLIAVGPTNTLSIRIRSVGSALHSTLMNREDNEETCRAWDRNARFWDEKMGEGNCDLSHNVSHGDTLCDKSQQATENNDIEKQPWSAADQMWANTDLLPSEYAAPVLGLIFLRRKSDSWTRNKRSIRAPAAARISTEQEIVPAAFYEHSALTEREGC